MSTHNGIVTNAITQQSHKYDLNKKKYQEDSTAINNYEFKNSNGKSHRETKQRHQLQFNNKETQHNTIQ